jgi:hypothetical protein
MYLSPRRCVAVRHRMWWLIVELLVFCSSYRSFSFSKRKRIIVLSASMLNDFIIKTILRYYPFHSWLAMYYSASKRPIWEWTLDLSVPKARFLKLFIGDSSHASFQTYWDTISHWNTSVPATIRPHNFYSATDGVWHVMSHFFPHDRFQSHAPVSYTVWYSQTPCSLSHASNPDWIRNTLRAPLEASTSARKKWRYYCLLSL